MDAQEGHVRGARLLDACAVDDLCLQPPLESSTDPSSYFVGDIDATLPQRPYLSSAGPANELLLADLDREELLLPEPAEMIGPSPGTSHAGLPWENFPSIPEHSELQLQPGSAPAAAPAVPPFASGPGQPPAQLPTQAVFVPISVAMEGPAPKAYLCHSPMSSIDPTVVGFSGGTSPTASSSSSLAAMGEAAGVVGMPRIASMPNLPGELAAFSGAASGLGGDGGDLRRRAASNRARGGMPRSRSANDVSDLSRYQVPHSDYLTPPHLRKGKGGRQPATDPRVDPRIDPKKARRILANRLSAAKSKLKQKSAADGLRQRLEMLRLQREGLAAEVTTLAGACAAQEAEREALRQQLQAAQDKVLGQLALEHHLAVGMLPGAASALLA